ncbi:MAG: insulinase family protein, partial [Myxococcota bacterium]|nr:insulinase family protein [Myxococcota bacterium]
MTFATLLLSSFFSGPASAAAIPKADYALSLDEYDLQISDYNFPSGLRILFQEEHTQPVVAITTVIDHGSDSDFPGMEGMAHVIEHLAFRAQHGDLPKNMDLIKQLGGNFNASTADDWTNYMTVAPVDALVPLLRLEAQRLTNGVNNVTKEHLDLEREICRNELRMNYENA